MTTPRYSTPRVYSAQRNAKVAGAARKHGMHGTPTYGSWRSMKRRCHDPKHKSYPRYGARGVAVCDRWRESFESFLADMGPRPNGKTLDRFPNPNGHYEPGNCRWATPAEQARNRRDNVLVTIGERTQCLADWAKEYGIDRYRVSCRIHQRGWTAHRAITTPVTRRATGTEAA